MDKPLIRYGELKTLAFYNTTEQIQNLASDWAKYVADGNFCKDEGCPFVTGNEFEYDTKNFLYYRARAITADVVNQNGDLFPHEEIDKAYNTFIGKGIYFNHDSSDPSKAFGIILDAVYSPRLMDTDDRYVEILGAIHKQAIREKRPGLLEDIESGKVTATSMGTLAKKAKCSICGNIATNMSNLCEHCNPTSPLYMKGRNIYGNLCYETNYGLTFIEDSIVYVPADPTAYMLEIYASKQFSEKELYELNTLFNKYSNAKKRKIKSFIEVAMDNPKESKKIVAESNEDYKKQVFEVPEDIGNVAEKILDSKIKRIIEEEIRKFLAPTFELLDKVLRPKIKERAEKEAEKVKENVDQAVGEVDSTQSAPKKQIPQPVATSANIKNESQRTIELYEKFSEWPEEDKEKLIEAIKKGGSWKFIGQLIDEEESNGNS